jgi:hypothetical protein
MLADDELDFEFDLADLGDLEGFDPNAMTAEELESQLGVDLDIDLEPISEESLSKAASAKEATGEKQDKKAEGKKTEDKKTENKKAEDKKAVEVKKDVDTTVKQATSPKVPDQEEKKRDQAKKFEKKPIPSTLDNQHNSYKNRNFSNNNRMNYYAMQQQAMFFPQAQANFMGMK